MDHSNRAPMPPLPQDMVEAAELADLREMRERAGTLYALPGGAGPNLDTMRGAGAYVLFGEPGPETEELKIKAHFDNRKSARMYISRPELCSKAGLIEWIEYFTSVTQ